MDEAYEQDEPYERGMRIRPEVLGDAHVDGAQAGAGEFGADFQDFVTRYAWGGVWARPGLSRRDRSLLTLALLVALGRFEELPLHVRGALHNGLDTAQIREVLLHTAVYAGVPAANSAFRVAAATLAETPSEPA